ncbi:MAG: hypothetical protein ACLP4W_03485 [Mycobacterium sp.]|uniref:hypothetical protein n=1 Tax=Mycobacterium sp. TaxID=1785 RepID=UPI003F9AAC98
MTMSQSWQAGHDWVTGANPTPMGQSISHNAKYIAQSHPNMSASFCQEELVAYQLPDVVQVVHPDHPVIDQVDWYQGCLAGMAENYGGELPPQLNLGSN